jgi:hypothetical protein
MRAWLVFDRKTGTGLLVLFGPFRPSQQRLKRVRRLVGIAEVIPTPQNQAALLLRGPEGLRFNQATGAVEVACH